MPKPAGSRKKFRLFLRFHSTVCVRQ